MTSPPIELLDGADETELPFLHEIVHIEPLPHEATRVRHHQAKVCPDELVLCARSGIHPAQEGSARSLVPPACTRFPSQARDEMPLEALIGQLPRHSLPRPSTPLARRLDPGRKPARRLGRKGRSLGRAVQKLAEALGRGFLVRPLLRVAKDSRRRLSTGSKVLRQDAQGPRRCRASEQRMERISFTRFDATRELDLLLMREHATAQAARGDGRQRGDRVVGYGGVSGANRTTGRMGRVATCQLKRGVDVVPPGGEGCAGSVHDFPGA